MNGRRFIWLAALAALAGGCGHYGPPGGIRVLAPGAEPSAPLGARADVLSHTPRASELVHAGEIVRGGATSPRGAL